VCFYGPFFCIFVNVGIFFSWWIPLLFFSLFPFGPVVGEVTNGGESFSISLGYRWKRCIGSILIGLSLEARWDRA